MLLTAARSRRDRGPTLSDGASCRCIKPLLSALFLARVVLHVVLTSGAILVLLAVILLQSIAATAAAVPPHGDNAARTTRTQTVARVAMRDGQKCPLLFHVDPPKKDSLPLPS